MNIFKEFWTRRSVFLLSAGTIATAIIDGLGGWDENLHTLIIMMCVDYVMGFLLAAVWHKSKKTESGALESNAMFKGLIKKGMMLLVILVGYSLQKASGIPYIRDVIIYAFMANELLSIIENAGQMGVPMPQILVRMVEVLQKKADVDPEEKNEEIIMEESDDN